MSACGIRFLSGDCRAILPTLPADSFDCIVTSPPYWGLRDYGVEDQIGLEPTLDAYVETLVNVGDDLWRVLKPEGTFWLNLGDSYAANGNTAHSARKKSVPYGLKPKDLCGVPWRVAFALQSRGWWLRSAIVWHKKNPMPEPVTDRPTSAYEMVFLLTKSERYFYDADAIAEAAVHPGVRISTAYGNAGTGRGSTTDCGANAKETRNARNVWTISSQPFSGSHFATMPPDLAERCIKAGCPKSGTVLDPFGGAGTTGLVADRLGRSATLIELNPAYRDMSVDRIEADAGFFAEIVK